MNVTTAAELTCTELMHRNFFEDVSIILIILVVCAGVYGCCQAYSRTVTPVRLPRPPLMYTVVGGPTLDTESTIMLGDEGESELSVDVLIQ